MSESQGVVLRSADVAAHYTGMRVMVTGASGAIGSNLTRRLLDLGASVVAIDDLSQGHRWLLDPRIAEELVVEDIADEAAVARCFASEPSLIFHLAALFANQNSVDHPQLDLRVNGLGTLNILTQIAAGGFARLVFASTSSALATQKNGPVGDDAPANSFGSPYQITKGLGEQYCRYFGEHAGLEAVRVRFFNSYGPGEVPGRYRNVIPNFFWLARHGKALPVFGTGTETRDWTYVDDIVEGLLRSGMTDQLVGRSVNLGTGTENTVLALADEVNRLVGNEAGVEYLGRRTWDTTTRRVASPQGALTLLGHAAHVTLKDGLAHTAAWFESHWDQIVRSQTF